MNPIDEIPELVKSLYKVVEQLEAIFPERKFTLDGHLVGSIGEDGFATDYITPTDFRASLLLAKGIWPFNDESFAVADVSADSLNEIEAAIYLREQVLGYPL